MWIQSLYFDKTKSTWILWMSLKVHLIPQWSIYMYLPSASYDITNYNDTHIKCISYKANLCQVMMTPSNGNIFRVTGPLCGEFTGPGEFPAQRPVTRSFDVLFDLRLNKRLSKQPWGWWFETPAWSLWRHRNANTWGNDNGSHRSVQLIHNESVISVWNIYGCRSHAGFDILWG